MKLDAKDDRAEFWSCNKCGFVFILYLNPKDDGL